jgi:hypothetical protein
MFQLQKRGKQHKKPYRMKEMKDYFDYLKDDLNKCIKNKFLEKGIFYNLMVITGTMKACAAISQFL